MAEQDLNELRKEIDEINQELVGLLNRRALVAQQIGKAKKGGPVYDPAREAEVIKKVLAVNDGPLDNEALTAIFKEVIAACRAIQEPLRVAYLGPEGTYSEEAARKQCGGSCVYVSCESIDEVLRAAESRRADVAVVPIENSTEGAVNRTLDLLLGTSLQICGEIMLPIHHQLLSKATALEDITEVCAHPQALAQCRAWLAAHLPGVKQTPTTSNAAAAKIAAQDPSVAAIAGKQAADRYQIPILHANIEDDATNTTRFVTLGKTSGAPSGSDKTSLIWSVANEAGTLEAALGILSRNDINMVKLESRPSKESVWEYVFYVDIDGHQQEEAVTKALHELTKQLKLVKVLGSYPRAG
jgi:chorismate mutase/prephenate dehydratase